MFTRALILPLLFLVGCGDVKPRVDAGGEDAGVIVEEDAGIEADAGAADAGMTDAGQRTDAGTDAGLFTDAGTRDAGPSVTLVTVSAPRELRGVWVSSVINLDWPTATGQSVDAGRASMTALVDSLADAGINALFFQVRPESDALYDSSLEPWSRYLTGTQGTDPGWDPLATMLELAHARGLEVHAWLNPYRASMTTTATTAPSHVTQTLSQYVISYNGVRTMNPGETAVREHVEAVVEDLLGHYDVDGLHFDDYFYPYPYGNPRVPFPDSATFTRYQNNGGTLSLRAWRRDNVNTLVRNVMGLIASDHPQVRFGISPFGIWRSGQPVPGLDAYDDIACDAPTWMQYGWVDYLAPQLYWRFGSDQDYATLADWWAARNVGGRHLFPGHAVHQLSSSPGAGNWPLSEITSQVEYTRTLASQGAKGDIHFRSAFVTNDTKGVRTAFKTSLYAKPALLPVVPRAGASVVPPVPFLGAQGRVISATNPQPALVRFYALYEWLGGGQWELRAVKGGAMVSFEVTAGTWAVSAIGRGGAESQGASLSIP